MPPRISRRARQIAPFLAMEVAERAFQLEREGAAIIHLEIGEPAGAFYIFADARDFGSDSRKLAFEILERGHVGVTPGVDFGAAGEGWLGFCYANSEAAIENALERLARLLPEFR